MAHVLIPWYSDGSNTKSYIYSMVLDTMLFTWYFTSNIRANVLNMVLKHGKSTHLSFCKWHDVKIELLDWLNTDIACVSQPSELKAFLGHHRRVKKKMLSAH